MRALSFAMHANARRGEHGRSAPATDPVAEFARAWAREQSPPKLTAFLDSDRDGVFDLVRIDLQQRWLRAGLGKRIADYCAELPGLELGDVPAALVYEEFVIRRQAGERVDPRDYLREYPAQAGELAELLALDEGTSTRWVAEQTVAPDRTVAADATVAADGTAGADLTRTSVDLDDMSTRMSLARPPQRDALDEVAVGDQVDDFDLLTGLGAGAFARVFLARQRSMQRLVAVKISADHGSEPQTLAQSRPRLHRADLRPAGTPGAAAEAAVHAVPAGRHPARRAALGARHPRRAAQRPVAARRRRCRDGGEGRDPAQRLQRSRRDRRPDLARDSRVAGATTCRGARLRYYARRAAPRCQTGERAAHGGGRPEAGRFQHQLQPQHRRDEPGRVLRRVAVLHVARAARGVPPAPSRNRRRSRHPRRHLLPRRRPVGAAHRHQTVRRRRRGRRRRHPDRFDAAHPARRAHRGGARTATRRLPRRAAPRTDDVPGRRPDEAVHHRRRAGPAAGSLSGRARPRPRRPAAEQLAATAAPVDLPSGRAGHRRPQRAGQSGTTSTTTAP